MTEVELRKLDDEMVGAFMEHNVDLILSHVSDDVLIQDFGQAPVHGKEAARTYLEDQFAVFSNERSTPIKRIIGDNEVFAELEWTGTNTGDIPLPDGSHLPATGKSFASRLAYYARVNDEGEVVEMRGYPDVTDIMGQLGAMG